MRAQELARRTIQCADGALEEAYFNLGGYLLSAEEYAEAADCYRKALQIDPDYELARKWLEDVLLILESKADERPAGGA